MASGDNLVNITARDFFPVAPYGITFNGVLGGISLPSKATTSLYAVKRLPKTASLSTGATVKILISDDPANPMPSKVVVLGVNFGKLGTTTTYVAPADAALGTQATATATLPATSGQTIEVSIPIVVANMASAAADTWVEVQVQRLGLNASDTGPTLGRILLYNVTVLDT